MTRFSVLSIPTLLTPKTALLSLLLMTSAGLQAQTFTPAKLGDTLTYLQQQVTPPNLSEDRPVATVYCQADVDVAGLTSNVLCHEKEGFDRLRDETAQAMTGRLFTPARVDGQAVPVRVVFRAVYAELDTQPPLMLLPNLGNMQKTFGHNYIAPQERLDSPQWYQRYEAHNWAEGQPFFSRHEPLTRVTALVGDKGETQFVRRIEAHGRYKRDAVILEKALKQSRFIPGFAENEPQRMRYVAVLNYPNS